MLFDLENVHNISFSSNEKLLQKTLRKKLRYFLYETPHILVSFGESMLITVNSDGSYE